MCATASVSMLRHHLNGKCKGQKPKMDRAGQRMHLLPAAGRASGASMGVAPEIIRNMRACRSPTGRSRQEVKSKHNENNL